MLQIPLGHKPNQNIFYTFKPFFYVTKSIQPCLYTIPFGWDNKKLYKFKHQKNQFWEGLWDLQNQRSNETNNYTITGLFNAYNLCHIVFCFEKSKTSPENYDFNRSQYSRLGLWHLKNIKNTKTNTKFNL